MSVFTPGHFTDLTGEAETEAGWPTSDEREEPGRDVRERKVGRERDTDDEGGPVARAAGQGISAGPRRPGRKERAEDPRKHGGNDVPDTGEPEACEGNEPQQEQGQTGQDNREKEQKEGNKEQNNSEKSKDSKKDNKGGDAKRNNKIANGCRRPASTNGTEQKQEGNEDDQQQKEEKRHGGRTRSHKQTPRHIKRNSVKAVKHRHKHQHYCFRGGQKKDEP